MPGVRVPLRGTLPLFHVLNIVSISAIFPTPEKAMRSYPISKLRDENHFGVS
jgi:hypothetical protein